MLTLLPTVAFLAMHMDSDRPTGATVGIYEILFTDVTLFPADGAEDRLARHPG